jgi:two-component system cell cycle sensor histidine kinase/response regulator CckA
MNPMNNLPVEKNRRILVIDDNRAIHDDFRKILSAATNAATLDVTEAELFGKPTNTALKIQYEIDSAYQGQDGVLLVKQARDAGRPYAMAFVDVRMPPGMDGVETTQKIWAVDPDIQIVLCTAYSDYSWDEMFEKIGNSDGLVILKKPFDTVEALQLAHAFTEKWWLHKQSRQKMEELESIVAGRTRELQQTNGALALQRAELRLLFDMTPAMIWFKDTENNIVRVNQRAAEAVGKPIAEIEGKSVLEIYPYAQEAAKYYADDLEVIHSGKPKIGIIETLRDPEGKTIWIETDKVPIRDEGGKVIGIVVMAQDITRRRRSEETVRRLAAIVENSDEAIIGETLDGIVTSWNHAAEKMFGYTAAEIIGQPLQLIIPPEQQHEEPEILSGFARGEQVCRFETIRVRKDGQRVDVSATISPIKDADGKIIGASKIVYDITERKRNEESLRLLGSAVEQSTESIVITDAKIDLPGPRIIFINPAYTKMTGYTAAEAIGKTPRILQGSRTDKAVLSRLRKNLEQGETFHGETVNYRKDGSEYDQEWQIAPIRDAAGTITNFVGVQRDITARKQIESQLFESQKLETVGKLAGGIAHEFNSILTAIIGQSELLLGDLPPGSPLIQNVTEIIKAANRAATLTRQLLAYGRKQFLQTEILDLNQIISSMESVFRHLMGGDVAVQIVPAADLRAVNADAGQIEQVIMNLVINGRDAMPNGGKLILETANVSFDAESVVRYPELKPGDYVMLAISDTGMGMSDAVKARVFEPFFTTKDVGQGTGLGLSTSYGIIKQSGGHMNVYSEQGRGSTFKIYLPQVEAPVKISAAPLAAPDLPPGTETILLVEDDPALRDMAAMLLRRLGYTVFTAGNGVEAMSVQHERATGHIDLLFTDVVMPHMSGKELADRVRALYPQTKILFTSAYTETAIVHQGVLDQGVTLLQKPFTPSALAKKLREVLDQKTSPAK